MRESRTYGSVRGALSNGRPYRDRFARNDGVAYLVAARGGFFPSAAAIAEISGFMK